MKEQRPPRRQAPHGRNANAPREREAGGKQLVAGRKPVRELLETAPERVDMLWFRKGLRDKRVEEIISLCRERGISFRAADREEMDRMYDGNHQGILAQSAAIGYVELEELLETAKSAPLPLVVVLDKVQDPGNLGTLARTMYALGAAGLVVGKYGGAYIGEGALRSSAGALNNLPVARVTNLSRALEICAGSGFFVYGAGRGETSRSLYDTPLSMPAVLVLGNEEKGLRPGVVKQCDELLEIPFGREFDSMNVAQAGAVFVGEFLRRHLKG